MGSNDLLTNCRPPDTEIKREAPSCSHPDDYVRDIQLESGVSLECLLCRAVLEGQMDDKEDPIDIVAMVYQLHEENKRLRELLAGVQTKGRHWCLNAPGEKEIKAKDCLQCQIESALGGK